MKDKSHVSRRDFSALGPTGSHEHAELCAPVSDSTCIASMRKAFMWIVHRFHEAFSWGPELCKTNARNATARSARRDTRSTHSSTLQRVHYERRMKKRRMMRRTMTAFRAFSRLGRAPGSSLAPLAFCAQDDAVESSVAEDPAEGCSIWHRNTR